MTAEPVPVTSWAQPVRPKIASPLSLRNLLSVRCSPYMSYVDLLLWCITNICLEFLFQAHSLNGIIVLLLSQVITVCWKELLFLKPVLTSIL